MDKVIQPWGWTGTSDRNDPFPTLFEILDPYKLRHGAIEKVAGCGVHPDILQFIDEKIGTTHPREDRYLDILCSNMGAGETWGSNINADRFLRSVLSYEGSDWGVQTFLKAGIYKHHVNKDPKKSYGDIICVRFASAPVYMDRVESIVRLDKERAAKVGAEDVIHAIEAGQFPAWSMGARVPHDVCSYCGNKAKTRANYCVHMKKYPNVILTAEHMDNRDFKGMTSDRIGLRICVDNPRPGFFDFSRVWIGAAPEARTLQKLAHAARVMTSAEIADMIVKESAGKSAAILKRIEDESTTSPIGKTLADVSRKEEDIPAHILNAISSRGLKGALSTATGMGIVLKPREFQRVVCVSHGRSDMADSYDRSGSLFAPSADVHSCDSEIAKDHFIRAFAHMLLSLVPKRSAFGPAITGRIMRVSVQPVQRSKMQPYHPPELNKLGGLYNGYRLALLEKMSEIGTQLVMEHPELAHAVYNDESENMFLGLQKQATALFDTSTAAYLLHAHDLNMPVLVEQNPGYVAHYALRGARALV